MWLPPLHHEMEVTVCLHHCGLQCHLICFTGNDVFLSDKFYVIDLSNHCNVAQSLPVSKSGDIYTPELPSFQEQSDTMALQLFDQVQRN